MYFGTTCLSVWVEMSLLLIQFYLMERYFKWVILNVVDSEWSRVSGTSPPLARYKIDGGCSVTEMEIQKASEVEFEAWTSSRWPAWKELRHV